MLEMPRSVSDFLASESHEAPNGGICLRQPDGQQAEHFVAIVGEIPVLSVTVLPPESRTRRFCL